MMCCSISSKDPARHSARESRLTFSSSSIVLLSTLSDAGSADNKPAMQTNPSSFVSCVVNSSLNHVNTCGSYRCAARTRENKRPDTILLRRKYMENRMGLAKNLMLQQKHNLQHPARFHKNTSDRKDPTICL